MNRLVAVLLIALLLEALAISCITESFNTASRHNRTCSSGSKDKYEASELIICLAPRKQNNQVKLNSIAFSDNNLIDLTITNRTISPIALKTTRPITIQAINFG